MKPDFFEEGWGVDAAVLMLLCELDGISCRPQGPVHHGTYAEALRWRGGVTSGLTVAQLQQKREKCLLHTIDVLLYSCKCRARTGHV